MIIINKFDMQYSIKEEERLVLIELKNDLYEFQKSLINNLIELSVFSFQLIISFVYSFNEYSVENIRRYGLREILIRRALRFFGLTLSEKKKDNNKSKEKSEHKQKSKSGFLLRSVKLICLPVYGLILFIIKIRQNNLMKNVKRNSSV